MPGLYVVDQGGVRRHVAEAEATPEPDPGETIPTVMRSSVEQHGITVTLDDTYPCGQYITGDWFVVGAATVTAISPAWDTSVVIEGVRLGVHGAQLDPLWGPQGYYDGSGYQEELNVALQLPLAVDPTASPRSLICTRGVNDGNMSGSTYPFWNGSTHRFRPNLWDAICVTFVDEPPAAGSFRPSFGGGIKVHKNRSEIDESRIPAVDHTVIQASVPAPADRLDSVRGPWLAVQRSGWQRQNFGPVRNGLSYGVDFAISTHTAILTLMFDYPLAEKEQLLRRVVQGGIDIYGMMLNGADYATNGQDQSLGGHFSGNKWPVVFSGLLLHDEVMANIRSYRVHPDTWQGALFHEDVQVYAHDGSDANCPRPLGAATWKESNREPSTERGWNNAYRRCCTANVWQSAALAARIMTGETDADAVAAWDHDLFFEYVDYYMDDDPSVEVGSNNRSRPNWSQYAWDALRPLYS